MTNDEIARFFSTHPVNIFGNERLRLPQLEGYIALRTTLRSSDAPGRYHVQIPAGGGKTGLMGIAPFGVARGRVLIVAPNLTTRQIIKNELDISNADSFYLGRGVVCAPFLGPYVSELKQGANIHDCSDAHIVVANIQQFGGANTRWYEQLAGDFFQMILVDEGHHNVAPSWQRLFDHFRFAPIVSFTATPERADGRPIDGHCIYKFGYAQSMLMGFTSSVESVLVNRAKAQFAGAADRTPMTADDVRKMTDHELLTRQVTLAHDGNRQIVEASLGKLREVRRNGLTRHIIASACSRHHAAQIQALYHERGFIAVVIHSDLQENERLRIYERLAEGAVDVLVDAQALHDDLDVNSFAVAAVFRPYNSLSSYVRFIRHVLRLADPMYPYSIANKVYVVSHLDLNNELWWHDFDSFDTHDRLFFSGLVNRAGAAGRKGVTLDLFDGEAQRSTKPLIDVVSEIVEQHRFKGDFEATDDALIERVFTELQLRGFKPKEHGLDEDFVRQRLRQVAQQGDVDPTRATAVQPQRRREGLRMLLHQQSRTMAEVVLARLSLAPNEKDLAGIYADNAHMTNVQVVISHIQGDENRMMNILTRQRAEASASQLQAALDAGPTIAVQVTTLLRAKLTAKQATR